MMAEHFTNPQRLLLHNEREIMSDFIEEAITKLAEPQDPQDTRRKRIDESAAAVKQVGSQGVINWIQSLNQGMELVWNNPRGLSPQEVVDGLGTDAVGIFTRHAQAAQFLVSSLPASAKLLKQRPDEFEVTPNEDGTVSITLKD